MFEGAKAVDSGCIYLSTSSPSPGLVESSKVPSIYLHSTDGSASTGDESGRSTTVLGGSANGDRDMPPLYSSSSTPVKLPLICPLQLHHPYRPRDPPPHSWSGDIVKSKRICKKQAFLSESFIVWG